MSAHDRVRWDNIYQARTRQPFPAPDPLLFNYTPHVEPTEEKRALDLAAGFGQNGLWLAAQGYITDLMEISRVALSRTRMEMAARNIRNLNLLQVDLDEVELEEQHYDLVCVFRYLKRDLTRKLRASVAPGGRIIYETFNMRYINLVPGFNTDFLLDLGELERMFTGWKIIHFAEEDHVSQIVAVNLYESDDEAYDPLKTNPVGTW